MSSPKEEKDNPEGPPGLKPKKKSSLPSPSRPSVQTVQSGFSDDLQSTRSASIASISCEASHQQGGEERKKRRKSSKSDDDEGKQRTRTKSKDKMSSHRSEHKKRTSKTSPHLIEEEEEYKHNPDGTTDEENGAQGKSRSPSVKRRTSSQSYVRKDVDTMSPNIKIVDVDQGRAKSSSLVLSLGQSNVVKDTDKLSADTKKAETKIAIDKPRGSQVNPFRFFVPFHDEWADNIVKKIYDFYLTSPVKIEDHLKYFELVEPQLNETYFKHKPIVLVLGEACSGKTSFINYLLGNRPYPGSFVMASTRSTKSFSIIDKGNEDENVSGSVLVSDPKRPFRQLNQFGSDFLENLNHVMVSKSQLVDNCYIVDTPGLSKGSTKARDGYEMKDVIKWFANKADSIMLMWDCYSWRMSDAVTELFRECLNKHAQKLVVVLNKCDLLKGTPVVPDNLDRIRHTSLKVTVNQVLWMVSKHCLLKEPVQFLNFSTHIRPLSPLVDTEAFDYSHRVLYTKFSLLKRARCMNIIDYLQTRLKRCYALMLIIREIHSKTGYFGKSKKQEILEDFDKFMLDVDSKCKGPFIHAIRKNVQVSEIKQNLESFTFNNLPKIALNETVVNIETCLNELIRMIPQDFQKVQITIPTEEELLEMARIEEASTPKQEKVPHKIRKF